MREEEDMNDMEPRYRDERLELWHGDCLQVMPRLVAGSVDAVICDLPYGTTACKWDSIIPFTSLWENYQRVIKSYGVVVLNASQPFSAALIMSNPKWFRHEWIWIKNAGSNFANTCREPMKEHESILVFSGGKWTYNKQMQERAESGRERVKTPVKMGGSSENYREFTRVNIKTMPELRVPSSWQKFNRERGLHPTQKPVALMEYLIRTYTNAGDTILDNCAGSFTTAIACLNTGRKFIGIERDAGYFEKGLERVMRHIEGMKAKEVEQPVPKPPTTTPAPSYVHYGSYQQDGLFTRLAMEDVDKP